jgi:hypothetical protein
LVTATATVATDVDLVACGAREVGVIFGGGAGWDGRELVGRERVAGDHGAEESQDGEEDVEEMHLVLKA